jgi:hypothetical protein
MFVDIRRACGDLLRSVGDRRNHFAMGASLNH